MSHYFKICFVVSLPIPLRIQWSAANDGHRIYSLDNNHCCNFGFQYPPFTTEVRGIVTQYASCRKHHREAGIAGNFFREAKNMRNELEHLRHKVAELEKQNHILGRNLQLSEDRFSKLFHTSSNLMMITTIKDGRIIDLNEASASFGGFSREELIDEKTMNYGLFEDPEQRNRMVRNLQEEGRIYNMKIKVRTKTGDVRTILLSADPITINDEPCLLSVSIDISAREKEEFALKQSEEKYRMLIENSLQGLAIIQDGRYVFCNSTFSSITGYSIEELLSLTPVEMGAMVHPDDQPAMRKRYEDRLAGKNVPQHYDFRGIRKDGTEYWLESYASLIEYNGTVALQLAHVDITERKQAEKSLRESEERFRLITETIDEIFWIFDLENGSVSYISPAHERIWGYPIEYFMDSKKAFFDPIHPEDRDRVLAVVARMGTGEVLDYEHRIVRADGSIRHIWNRGYPIFDEAGRLKQYVGVGQDITARRNAEEALRETKEYLNLIINSIRDPIFVKDREHKFVLVNDALCAFASRPREEMLGMTATESIPPSLATSIWEEEEDVFNTGRERLTEDNFSDSEGNVRTIMTRKALLKDNKGNQQIVGVLRDITEYKRLEAQLLQAQKMEAIGILAGGVAHDFNNLLNVINGYSELILEDCSQDNPIYKDLEQINKAGRRAASLTSQLLAFGRKQVMQPVVLDLNSAIKNMSSLLRRLIREDIEFSTLTQTELGLVNADPGQVQQIVMNLVVNARDAMPQGGKLTVETANVDFDENYILKNPIMKQGSYVMLAISDNGVGMDAVTQAHLFEPFFTTKERGKGTGLGLSTVYGIVKQSNGFIWVYSEPGKGSTFKVYFPRVEGKAPQTREEIKLATDYRGTETVLIVEDEAAVRSLASRILSERGYRILEAANGMEALSTAREFEGEIHLVLTDVIMPGMSGASLISKLEVDRPGIRALYISGYTDNTIVHHGILDSNVAYLQKPFTVESLTRKVREVLSV